MGNVANLSGTGEEAVQNWIDKMMLKGHEDKAHFSPNALRYFATHCCGLSEEEVVTVTNLITELARVAPEPVSEGELEEEESYV